VAAACGLVACVRTVRTASGATAVQIMPSSLRRAREADRYGSAHNTAELEALKARPDGSSPVRELDPPLPRVPTNVQPRRYEVAKGGPLAKGRARGRRGRATMAFRR
jgi:hypothetical protein